MNPGLTRPLRSGSGGDLCFCVTPNCACASRFVVLAVEETAVETRWSDIGSIRSVPG